MIVQMFLQFSNHNMSNQEFIDLPYCELKLRPKPDRIVQIAAKIQLTGQNKVFF